MRSVATVLLALGLIGAADAASHPNFLIILLDDVGVTDVGAYDEGLDLPKTPTIDAVAERGVLFRNAWSNPVCSPTRATIQTGRYSFRTGIGFIVDDLIHALDPAEVTLPELLDTSPAGYRHAAIGKWHLGNDTVGGALAPNIAGYDHFEGTLTSINDCCVSYYDWTKVTNGSKTTETKYNTTACVDDALRWIEKQRRRSPWLCYLAFNAPHFPYHAPPTSLHTVDLTGLPTPTVVPRPYYKAMVEAVDSEIDRLLTSLGPELDDTYVFILGDNGTPAEVIAPPTPPIHGKPSLYEGGINVPLIVSGPGVAERAECGGLVNTVDLFATVAELAAIDPLALLPPTHQLDGISLVPYLTQPDLPSLRPWAFSEIFDPNGAGPHDFIGHAIRDERYKIVRSSVLNNPEYGDAMFDLIADPYEHVNLLNGTLTAAQAQKYDELNRALDDLLDSEP